MASSAGGGRFLGCTSTSTSTSVPMLVSAGSSALHRIELFDLLVDGPRRVGAAGLEIHVALHGQCRQPAHHGFLRRGELEDELGHVVLQLFLAARGQVGDGALAVGGVGGREPQVHALTAIVDRIHAEFVGAVFLFRIGLRIDDLEREVAVGQRGQLFEQFAHARTVTAHARILGRGFLAEEEVEVHRLLEPAHDALGALRHRVEIVRGQVDLRAAQQVVREQHDTDEQRADDCESARTRVVFLSIFGSCYFDLRASSTTVLASRKNAMTARSRGRRADPARPW